MVESGSEVELIVRHSELALREEKRGITHQRQIQQIDCLLEIGSGHGTEACALDEILGAAV